MPWTSNRLNLFRDGVVHGKIISRGSTERVRERNDSREIANVCIKCKRRKCSGTTKCMREEMARQNETL